MIVTDGLIIERQQLNPSVYRIGIRLETAFPEWKSGNFVMLHLQSGIDPLLPRPFSIFHASGNYLELIFKVIGKGTAMLAADVFPRPVKLWGPLGNVFPERTGKKLLVAGGLGVVPLLSMTSRYSFERIFAGFRSAADVFLSDELSVLGAQLCSDDGSFGRKAFVTTLLDEYLRENPGFDGTLYACGPEPFLKSLAELTRSRGLTDVQASLETFMACGFGVCLGCALNTKNGTVKVCKDGPVFNLSEVM